MNADQEARLARLREGIRSYLGNGGLFNPECMEHEKVRDLLMDIADAIDGEPPNVNSRFLS